MAIVFGYDASGRGNNWTANNLSSTAGVGNDSLVDSPTAYGTDTGVGGTVRGNYATLNPLINPSADTFSNGNLQVVTSSSNYGTSVSTMATPTTGKWYAECTIVATASYAAVGICSTSSVFTATSWIGSLTGVTYYGNSGQKFVNASGSAYGATYGANDIIGVAYDADNLQITFYKNGTTQGLITGVTAGTYYFGSSEWDPASGTQVWNFGQRAFAYTAPSGFKALCTQNLPTPTIGATSTTQANDYFNVLAYSGTGSNQTLTVGFQPDFAWFKKRSAAESHILQNSIAGNTKFLISNSTAAEDTSSALIQSFNSDGVTIGTSSTINGTSTTYAGWFWNAGGSTVTNTSGTISAQVRASTTAGFSIATYTGNGSAGATVGHGLGVTPSMIFVKSRSVGTAGWVVWHTSLTLGANSYLVLEGTQAQQTTNQPWNNTLPTSSVFSLRTWDAVNQNGSTYVAYLFAAVAGYSAFGSYTGNASADGPFIYTGFRPEFVMIKCSSTTGDWVMQDVARSPYNVSTNYLVANASTAEQTGQLLDFVSNGFKIRVAVSGAMNSSGATYIFMAFAENPFKYALAR